MSPVDMLVSNFGEVIVGLAIGILGWAFRNWATIISETTERILRRIDSLAAEFHEHRMETQGRVTRVETKLESVEKLTKGQP